MYRMNKKDYEYFLKEMKSITELSKSDPEAAHNYADSLLLEFLKDLGYQELVDEFEQVNKWYA